MASMEPRFFKRGNLVTSAAPMVADPRFNGTTLFQTWKSVCIDGHAVNIWRFNGTTLFQTWK